MATKAKKSNQQALRKKEQAKRLNRIRGMVGNPNLSDADAMFYAKALRNKSTPSEFLAETEQDIRGIINTFDTITSVGSDTELMGGLKVHRPELHASIEDNYKFLTDCTAELDKIITDNKPTFDALEGNEMDLVVCGDAIDGLSNIQNNLAANAEALMITTKLILDTYVEIEQSEAELEQQNMASSENLNPQEVV